MIRSTVRKAIELKNSVNRGHLVTRQIISSKYKKQPLVPHARFMSTIAPAITSTENPFIKLKQMDPHALDMNDSIFVDSATIAEMQQKAAQMFPAKPIFGVYDNAVNGFKYITYQDFDSLVDYTRGILIKLGLKENDKVALISNNRVEYAAVLFATIGLKGQFVPMYEAQKEKDWKYIVEDSGAKVVVAASTEIYDVVKTFVGKVGVVEHAMCFDAPADAPYSYRYLLQQSKASAPTGTEGNLYPRHDKIDEEDLAALIYTSGTTGNPKGVELTHRNIIQDIYCARKLHERSNVKDYSNLVEVYKDQIARNTGPDKYIVNMLSHNVTLCFLPWSHVFGLTCELNMLQSTGGCMAIVPHRDMILTCLLLVKPTLILSVPMLFNKVYDGVMKTIAMSSPIRQKLFHYALSVARRRNHLLEYGKEVGAILEWQFKLADKIVLSKVREKLGGKIRYMASGGAATGQQVLEFFEDIGIPVADGYGLTETSPMITAGGLDFANRRLGCVGVALPGCDLRIVDPETLADLPAEGEGEIVAAGPMIMRGYHHNEQANKEVFFFKNSKGGVLDYEEGLKRGLGDKKGDVEGGYKKFFRTGDMGRLVENKFLKITGRIKEQYKLNNGKYVVPSPLEDVLTRSHSIAQCFLYGTNQNYNVLLVVPDYVELKNAFSASKNVAMVGVVEELVGAIGKGEAEKVKVLGEKLFANEDFVNLISQGIVKQSEKMKSFERPQKWLPITTPFSVENQMLTPKLSLRRNNIKKHYQDQLLSLYKEGESVGHRLSHPHVSNSE